MCGGRREQREEVRQVQVQAEQERVRQLLVVVGQREGRHHQQYLGYGALGQGQGQQLG